MKSKQTYMILGLVLMLAAASATALANDKIISTVTIPEGQPIPIIEKNGTAQGTIRLNYTFVGTQFPCGVVEFARFNLGMVDEAGTGQLGVYPALLNLSVSGNGTPVRQSFSPDSLEVSGVGWSGSSLVTIYIDCSKIDDNPTDGDVIDGQMNVSAAPKTGRGNAHLDTITTIQVHIKLVFPTACLKLYSFESNQGGYQDGDLLSSLDVIAKSGSIKSTNPGQVSVDALVANICTTPALFDLAVALDPLWLTNPHGNPGNATFIYTTTGEFDPETFNLADFGEGTAQGQTLCLSNIALDGGDSFLTRIHSAIIKGSPTSTLPTNNTFGFSATLYAAGSGCSGSPLGPTSVNPLSQATSTLPFTIK